MNTINLLLPCAILFLGASCQEISNEGDSSPPHPIQVANQLSPAEHNIARTGKIKNAQKFDEIYSHASLDSLPFPEINDDIILGLKRQLKVLELKKSKKPQRIASLDITIEKLKETIEILLGADNLPNDFIKNQLNAYQIWGKDRKGHVQFTGYYSPELRVKSTPDEEYKYPIYAKPKNWDGHLPTRTQIDGEGILQGQDLELAFAKNLVDIYYLQLQGSGYVKFVDTGKKQLLRFAGGNGYKYRSIERYIMQNEDIKVSNISVDGVKKYLKNNPEMMERVLFSNPSYAFFKLANTKVRGSAGVTLMDGISIAVDPNYIPIGSILLASMPAYNKRGKFTHHEYKLLMAQDVGGAIDGTGHVDVYSGVGNSGQLRASARHHYGRMWLLIPKGNKQLAMK